MRAITPGSKREESKDQLTLFVIAPQTITLEMRDAADVKREQRQRARRSSKKKFKRYFTNWDEIKLGMRVKTFGDAGTIAGQLELFTGNVQTKLFNGRDFVVLITMESNGVVVERRLSEIERLADNE
jgi:hypothetical protein